MIVRNLQHWWQRLTGYHVPMNAPINVIHRPEQSCFEATVDGHRCVADYRLDGQLMHMHHTLVHPALEGRGIAAKLVEAALQWAQTQGYRVNPSCSYVRVYIQRHAQWQPLVR